LVSPRAFTNRQTREAVAEGAPQAGQISALDFGVAMAARAADMKQSLTAKVASMQPEVSSTAAWSVNMAVILQNLPNDQKTRHFPNRRTHNEEFRKPSPSEIPNTQFGRNDRLREQVTRPNLLASNPVLENPQTPDLLPPTAPVAQPTKTS
jgi:hypothetical protein